MIRTKAGAAMLSVVSNSVLIALKLAAGAITGSIAILTEAIHSAIDLLASIVALVSVRRADVPPDEDHPYGHEKVESLAATIEGMLILVGAGVIIYEATRRLVSGSEVESLGVGLAVIAFSMVANLAVSSFLSRRAEALDSPALEGDAAHLRADALTSFGVLAGLLLVEITGEPAFDAIAALFVAVAIVVSGVRIMRRSGGALIDEAPPPEELDRIEATIAAAEIPEMVGYHKLRARRSGRRRWIDLHVQFREGTTLERAHEAAHQLRDAIRAELGGADVLIHVEPESSARPMTGSPLRWGRPTAPATAARWSGEVDRGRHADGDQRDRVAGVAVQRQQDGRDGADDDRGEPGDSRRVHACMLQQMADHNGREALTAGATEPSPSDAEAAVARFMALSTEIRGCAILGPGGVLAATGERDRWAGPATDLLAAADAAAGGTASQAHVATEDGEAYVVRLAGLAMVAVTDRFTLASLILADMRATLRGLVRAGSANVAEAA